ncbi:hypothetical protein GBAR_LOCUS12104, partial [Geodia barretti]
NNWTIEQGNRYTITATVFNAAGSALVSNAVTATTMQTDPGHPTLVRSGIVTSSSITVRWQAVSCLDRNGDVTSYRAQ